MKTLRLNKKKIFDYDLQKNLRLLYKKYGPKFYLQWKKIKIPCIITKDKIKSNNNEFYTIKYDIDRNPNHLYPFKITFMDYSTMETTDNCSIDNISKTKDVSGTDMVSIILLFLKNLNARRACLIDAASIKCMKDKNKLSLSLFKLIEKKKTFYQKFGFKICIGNNTSLQIMYKDSTEVQKILLSSIQKFKKIKVVEYTKVYQKLIKILSQVIIDQDYKNLNIVTRYVNKDEGKLSVIKNRENLLNMINYIERILRIFSQTKQKYIYKLMIDLFYNSCGDYNHFLDEGLLNNIVGVEYKRKKVFIKHFYIFQTIAFIKNRSKYCIDF